jgi:hypothetical protein
MLVLHACVQRRGVASPIYTHIPLPPCIKQTQFVPHTYYTVEREHKSIEWDGAADEGAGSAAGRVRRTVSALASVSILCF